MKESLFAPCRLRCGPPFSRRGLPHCLPGGTVIEAIGRDELLFADGCSRSQSYICMVTAPALAAGLQIYGCLIEALEGIPASMGTEQVLNDGNRCSALYHPRTVQWVGALSRFATILPWYIQNAFVHYIAPRGLEQYSGGGWASAMFARGRWNSCWPWAASSR